MSTSLRAETSATMAQCNTLQQRRLDNYNDLIDFEPHEYDIEDNDHMVIINPDDAPILPLHDVVTDNRYGNVDYQNEYEESPPSQRRPLTPVRIPPPSRRTVPIPRRSQLPPNPPMQQFRPQPPPAHGAIAANPMDQLIQSMNNLILAMKDNASQPREAKVVKFPIFSSGDQDPLTWLDEFDEACVTNHITEVRRFDILPSHLKGPAYTW
ncbi:gag-pol fusion protein [Gigaspora margarita]|uniref:Gag-pol fusion protein n=1 Tax=Gigaspora margarita TaxID=4874 RepID=A0A8H4AVR1_GIGMA|nr:gag-pol fusion protein [Gigaspora margarita]